MTIQIHHLQLPLSEDRARTLELGAMVTVSGLVFTGRSLFHIRAIEQQVLPRWIFSGSTVSFTSGR